MKSQIANTVTPLLWFWTLLASGPLVPIRAESCGGGYLVGFETTLPTIVGENESIVRVWLRRYDTNSVETVDYFASDGPARFPAEAAQSGVHYIAQNGSVSFPAGHNLTSVDIPLLDNGLLDGPKDFTLVVTNTMTEHLVRIEDNELHSGVDPLFAPEVIVNGPNPPIVMHDGRVLVSALGEPTMLRPNGSLDTTFASNITATRRFFNNAAIWAIQALSDSRILAGVTSGYTNEPSHRLIRLLPNGVLDSVLFVGRFGTAAAQPDGKILVHLENSEGPTLSRLNEDGSLDPTFAHRPNHWFVLARDGKILSVLSNTIARLSPDGLVDNTFTLVLLLTARPRFCRKRIEKSWFSTEFPS